MIFMKFYIDFHQNSSNHRNMFEVVPENNHYNLKTTPTPYSPLPHFPKAVKLGSEPQNRENALKGRIFSAPGHRPEAKSRLKKGIGP
jgi:hypothetical protein